MPRIFANLNGFTQVAIAVISLIAIGFHLVWTRRSTALGPTILTTLGIFFCFSGIAWGLLDFDPRDIRSSVPHLIEGIRTSFWASVFGIGWALTLKIRVALFGDAQLTSTGSQEGATVADLATRLMQLNQAVAGVDGDEETSLVGQLKLLRAESSDQLTRMTVSFDRHAQRVVEANAKALVAGLSEVVRNYNILINEQFGESFRRLNSGVERLVIWQAQYQEQLNRLIEQETVTRNSLTESAVRFSELVSRSAAFTEVANSLRQAAVGLGSQTQQLESGLRNLNVLTQNLSDALAAVQKESGQARKTDEGRKPSVAVVGS